VQVCQVSVIPLNRLYRVHLYTFIGIVNIYKMTCNFESILICDTTSSLFCDVASPFFNINGKNVHSSLSKSAPYIHIDTP